jgi:hypothetical protein
MSVSHFYKHNFQYFEPVLLNLAFKFQKYNITMKSFIKIYMHLKMLNFKPNT